jgi:hypothetical protein
MCDPRKHSLGAVSDGNDLPECDVGTQGYPADTPGYPDEDWDEVRSDRPADLDLERYLEPREAAKLLPSDQPVAHEGKAGWAVERETGRAIWISGEMQFDVLNRLPGAVRDEPGLTDVPRHGGLPDTAVDDEELRSEERRGRRRRVQIGLKLTPDQASDLEGAAELYGVTRTTLARLLVVRGIREILDRAQG